jgi:hypothetical protein
MATELQMPNWDDQHAVFDYFIDLGVAHLELETSEQAKGGRHPSDGMPTKTEQLAAAGISKSWTAVIIMPGVQ